MREKFSNDTFCGAVLTWLSHHNVLYDIVLTRKEQYYYFRFSLDLPLYRFFRNSCKYNLILI